MHPLSDKTDALRDHALRLSRGQSRYFADNTTARDLLLIAAAEMTPGLAGDAMRALAAAGRASARGDDAEAHMHMQALCCLAERLCDEAFIALPEDSGQPDMFPPSHGTFTVTDGRAG